MISYRLNQEHYKETIGLTTVIISGYFIQNSILLDNRYICQQLLTNKKRFLKNIDGDFLFIIIDNSNNTVAFGVDHVRKKSLFYKLNQGSIFITDNISSKDIGNLETNPSCILEFKYSGYVTGERTLINNFYCVKPGEYIIWGNNNIRKIIFYNYYPTDINEEKDEGVLVETLDECLDQAIIDTLIIAKGKKILLPLSGGNDSRLLLAMLNRHKIENVVCFSYGKKNNTESLISKYYANKLGYEWIFIEYNNSKWYNLYHSKKYYEYSKFSSNYTAIPNLLEFLAVDELSNKFDLSNHVFLPGHTGDFISGGHLEYIFRESDFGKINYDTFIARIIDKHFSLVNDYKSNLELYEKIFYDPVLHKGKDNNVALPQIYEHYEYLNRQSKYIINSSRLYEFYNSQSVFPLWRKSFVSFWRELSFYQKFNKRLYLLYLNKSFPDSFPNVPISKSNFNSRLFLNHSQKYLTRISNYFDYFTNSGSFYGTVGLKNFLIKRHRFRSIIGYTVDDYLYENKINAHKTHYHY